MYLNKYTATMMAAAMAALPGMFPAPSHGATGNEGAPDELTFVSLSPELYEIAPSSAITNPELLGDKTQLFYAKPKQEGEKTTVASLSGAKIGLVAKRKGVPVTEAGGKPLKFVWGRLDNLIATDITNAGNGMWNRPSAAFLSVCHSSCDELAKTPNGLCKLRLGEPYESQTMLDLRGILSQFKNIGFPKTRFPLLLGSRFTECPWFDMLRREKLVEHKGKLVEHKASDQRVVETFRDVLKGKQSPTTKEVNTIQGRKYPHWIDYARYSSSEALGFSRDNIRISERAQWPLVAEEPLKGLNQAVTATGNLYPGFNEWLYLGDSFWHRDDYPHTQKRDKKHTYYHLLPISGAVFSESDFDAANKLLSLGKQKEEPTITEGRTKIATSIDVPIAKAVILAPEDELFPSREAFLLGIMADWHSENAGNDALSLNTCCKPNGGHTHPVRIPEIANTDFANLHILRQEIPYLLPRITWVDKEGIGQLLIDRPQGGEAEVRWPNGAKKIKLSEGWCDPIAYQAGARNRQLKLIVALPSYQYTSKSLNELGIGKRPTTGERYSYEWELKCKAKKNKAQSQPQGGQDWASFKPLNYKVAFNRNPRFKIIPGAEDITVVRGDEEYPGYSLYEVTVTADTAINERITAGFMEHDWTFSLYNNGQPYTHNDSPIEFALHSEMPAVYTIFGPSTWFKYGLVGLLPLSQNFAVLPWKEALDALCKQILCNANSGRTAVTNDASASTVLNALHEGISRMTTYTKNVEKHKRYANEAVPIDRATNAVSGTSATVSPFEIGRLVGGAGLVDTEVVCTDVACLFATLPRICGLAREKSVTIKHRRPINRQKDDKEENHTYNVYNGTNYDATPPPRNNDSRQNTWEGRGISNMPGAPENVDANSYSTLDTYTITLQ